MRTAKVVPPATTRSPVRNGAAAILASLTRVPVALCRSRMRQPFQSHCSSKWTSDNCGVFGQAKVRPVGTSNLDGQAVADHDGPAGGGALRSLQDQFHEMPLSARGEESQPQRLPRQSQCQLIFTTLP